MWRAIPQEEPRQEARLPYFEAALARSRGLDVDPNHPDMVPSFTPYDPVYRRPPSRSPSPVWQSQPLHLPPFTGDPRGHPIDEASLHLPPFRGHERMMHEEEDQPLNPYMHEEKLSPPIYAQTESRPLGYDDEHDIATSATQHFGPAPVGRVDRRTHNARRIKQSAVLDDNGLFAVDMPIPTRLAQFLPVKGVEEQKTTRYSAITTKPDEVPGSGFRLRQNMMGRTTEMFITITMYNEDAELFCRTMYGVMRNIAHLCGRKNSKIWGKDGWQKIVVCIVADGRKQVDPRVLDCLAALGVYQEGAMTSSVKDRAVTAHCFEYTTSFALDDSLQFRYPDRGIVPCQILFCLKELNARKINSHRWALNAFAPLLSPNVCILIDVGTRPEAKSLYHLWKAFDLNSNVGGACGEIATYKGKAWRLLLNPLVASQFFEYKMSNILDKPFESVFGYVTVLPGAFSAYRWIALQNDADGNGPLASYFEGEQLHTGKADSFTANLFLAEDRILCWKIVAKPRSNWVLRYVKSAVGTTDCPEAFPEFIAQRRRWLNGSLFAAVYSLMHVGQIWATDHSLARKLMLMLESFYNALALFFSWFALANFYIFFVILTSALEAPEWDIPQIKILNIFAQYVYLGALVACFILSMGNRPQGSPWKYKSAIYIFAVLTTYMLVCAVLCTMSAVGRIHEPIFAQMVVSIGSTYGVFVVSSLMALEPWHITLCFVQYLLLSPTYINVLSVYAYSNLHDLSWGTKGADNVAADLGSVQGVGKHVQVELVSSQTDIDTAYQDSLDNIRLKRNYVEPKKESGEQLQKDVYANFRTNLLLLWSLSNAVLASAILSGSNSETFSGGSSRSAIYMLVILTGMALFRFICATLYLIIRLFSG